MTEPDFEQLARQLLIDLPDKFLYRGAAVSSAVPGVAEQLRQVWNARGAADVEAVNEIAHTNWKEIESAIRTLDRVKGAAK